MNYAPAVLKLCVTVAAAAFCVAPFAPGGLGPARADAPQIFDEAAEETGLKFRHYNGATGKLFLPEMMGSGAALFDFDNDGDLDVFLVQGSVLEPGDDPARTLFPWRETAEPRGRLFRNDLAAGRDGRPTLKFTDVTTQSGIAADGYGMGVIAGDVNNDGWPDLYLCNLGQNQLISTTATARSRT